MDKPIVERFLLGNLANEEKKVDFSGDHEHGISEGINEALSLGSTSADYPLSMETSSQDGYSLDENEQEDKLISTKVEMAEMRKENERLKIVLAQMVKEYKSLQTQFVNYAKQVSTNHQQNGENDQLVSLTLGRHGNDQQPHKVEKNNRCLTYESGRNEKFNHEGLKLRLDCRSISEPARIEPMANPIPILETRFEEHKEDESEPITDTRPLGKSLKTMRSFEDEISQHHTQLKRARVSVRARCDTPTMNDGCQWRKYGQKTAKGNPCPRAYYRCTVSPMCPVRKQVQRCAEDTSILITTYEGNHNHPLSISATSMASTTSAAATMLLSGSSTTTPNVMSASTTLNSHPTITLDLTSLPKCPAASTSNVCLNFSSNSNTTNSSEYLSYGTPLYNRSMSMSSLYRPFYMPMKNTQNGYLPMLVDQKAVISEDPRCRSVVAAAIAPLIYKYDHNGSNENKSGQNFKFGHK